MTSEAHDGDLSEFDSVLDSLECMRGREREVEKLPGGLTNVNLKVTTSVTCPTVRIHPAILAQAAATAALMLEGRFLFGVGTGENLNEHRRSAWPPASATATSAPHPTRRPWTATSLRAARGSSRAG